jgi:hypothetical protein
VEDSRALLADQHVAQAVTDATMIFQRRCTFSDYVFADGICRQKLDKILKIQLVTFHALLFYRTIGLNLKYVINIENAKLNLYLKIFLKNIFV